MIKIIQVAEAPNNIVARFEVDGGLHSEKVVCLGICADGGVHYISHSSDGLLHPVTEMDNFHDVVFL